MRRVELEAFLKGFGLFFLSIFTLFLIVLFTNYTKEIERLESKLLDDMRLCSFDLQCDIFSIDFEDKADVVTYKLYKKDEIKAYFPILKSNDNFLVISLTKKQYQSKKDTIKWKFFKESVPIFFAIFAISIVFSLYTLSPLRHSLHLTEEFIKDILHDFNTPLATLRLNSSMLKKEIGENRKITRIESSIESVLSLQDNLRCYLFDHEMQRETLELKSFIEESVVLIEKSYGNISYEVDIPSNVRLKSNPKAFRRIVNNLISNASKYNKHDGSVIIQYKDNQLIVIDTGKGIKDIHQIFDRFYKEQDRGIGVGLHIVKKLCDELNIKIKVESQLGVGSRFILKFPR